jgi:ABC-type sugar transport system ATPase subunit
VVTAEPLGAETHITVDWDGHPVRLRAPGFLSLSAGDRLRIRVPQASLHLFNQETGRAL